MPLHDWRCAEGHAFERYVERTALNAQHFCDCGAPAERVYLRFPMAWVSPEIRYDSPIDGRPITSKQARAEDLARSNCVPYDPELKTEQQRKLKAKDDALDRAVDETVDREIALMPARSREKLQAELEGGLVPELVRQTATATQ